MSDMNDQFVVQPSPKEHTYLLLDTELPEGDQVIGKEEYVDVPGEEGPGDRVLFHTEVSEDYGGKGLASQLVQFAVEDAIARGFSVVPVCSYVKKWLDKHNDYETKVVPAEQKHLSAVPRDH